MATKYTYSISNDFLNSSLASSELTSEIQISTITGTLSHVNTDSDVCDIWFDAPLSSAEQTTLSGVVSSHDGQHPSGKYEMTARENIGAKKGVYICGSDEVKLARADSENTLPCVGFTESTASSGATAIVWTNDILTGFSGLTPGAEYYVSTTSAGEITTTKPSSGSIISAGVAKTATELDIHIIVLPTASSGTSSIFGSQYQVVESDGLSSITGTTALQEKLRLDVTDLPLGQYKIAWNFDWLYSNTNNKFQASIEIDDGFTFIHMMTQEPQDSSNEYNESGFNILTDFSGTHHFDLDYRTLNASHTAKILMARMEIWRVA